MKLSSISRQDGRLRVTAIAKRESSERAEECDEAGKAANGEPIELRAYVHQVTRNLIAFEWELLANTAFFIQRLFER